MQSDIAKKIVLEFLSFLRYKVKNDLLTMEEVESLARMLEESLTVKGTIEDLARFYNQPSKNVTTVISRRMLDKPTRRVFYSFNAFRRIVPSTWKYHSGKAGIQHDAEK